MVDVVAHGGIARKLLGARIRSDWQYRTSFFTFLISQALVTGLELAALLIVLEVVPTLGGWNRVELLFLFGLASLPFTSSAVVFGSLEEVSTYVRSGEFDRLLLRPTPVMLQLTTLEFQLRRIGKMVPDVGVFVWAIAHVDITWSPGVALYLVVSFVAAFVIYASLWIAAAALSYWTVSSAEAANTVTYGGHQANSYPLHIYPGWIRGVLGWVIPLAFVSYVPTIHLLGTPNPLNLPSWFAYLGPVVAAAMLALTLSIWRAGIRRYQSTGS